MRCRLISQNARIFCNSKYFLYMHRHTRLVKTVSSKKKYTYISKLQLQLQNIISSRQTLLYGPEYCHISAR